MIIPKKLHMFGHDIEVLIVNTNDERKERGNEGRAAFGTNRIYLDESMQKSRQEEVFIHEVLHYIFFNTGYYREWGDKIEEDITNRVATALYAVLKDNNMLK